MENFLADVVAVAVIGVGATAIMDLWALLRRPLLGLPLPNYCLVGRWLGHMPRGRFVHDAIGASSRIPGECLIGWCAHYATGVAFAGLLIVFWGDAWLNDPAVAPALIVGLATLIAPFLLMQPGMGAGIAARRAPNPAGARLQSVLTHLVFGCGLYLAARLLNVFGAL